MVVECKKIFATFLGSFVFLLQSLGITKVFVPGWNTVSHFNVCLFPCSAHDFLPLNLPKKKKAGKIPF